MSPRAKARPLLAGVLLTAMTLGESYAAPFALFWSREHTWVLDAGEGSLYRAPKLYAQGPGGVLFEYRLETHSAPSGSDDQATGEGARPYGWLYRWMSLERYLVGDTGAGHDAGAGEDKEGLLNTTLTSHYRPDQVKGDFNDEHQVLQFTGERVTLARWVSQRTEKDKLTNRSLYTIDLANRQTLSQLGESTELTRLTRELFPQLIPSCLTPTSSLIHWELAGQRATSWLLMLPSEQGVAREDCPASGALRVRPPVGSLQAGALSWDPLKGRLLDAGEPILGGIVDVLLHPSGDLALVLEGPKRSQEEGLFVPDPLGFDEPNVSRALSLWRRRGSPRLLSLPALLELQRLDGARWIQEGHPLLQLLQTHFTNLESPGCYAPLKSHRVERYHRPPAPELTAHICRVETYGRMWGGVDDLSAQVIAAQTNRTLFVDIWVRDATRASGDMVTLWIGSAEAPVELKIKQREVIAPTGVADQILVRWVEGSQRAKPRPQLSQRKAQSMLVKRSADRGAPERGYLVSVELPLSLVKGRMSVSIQDVDRAKSAEYVKLWVVGEPSKGYEAVVPARIEVE